MRGPWGDIRRLRIGKGFPVDVRVIPWRDEIEIGFGRAFPGLLVINREALGRLCEQVGCARQELNEHANRRKDANSPVSTEKRETTE
ncbi:MAG: hypothetical protein J2P17_16280 [Mycobacterium sp.]|nr:hypothetical protein [Mycobacterium sp.]